MQDFDAKQVKYSIVVESVYKIVSTTQYRKDIDGSAIYEGSSRKTPIASFSSIEEANAAIAALNSVNEFSEDIRTDEDKAAEKERLKMKADMMNSFKSKVAA